MKVSIPDRLKNQWLDFASKHIEIKSLILFGSRARGDHDNRSDFDIAISAPKANQEQWLKTFFFFKDDSDTLAPIDVVRWEEAPKPLRRKIQNEGYLMYEREKIRAKHRKS